MLWESIYEHFVAMASRTEVFLIILLVSSLRSTAQFEGDELASNELVDDVVGQSLFGNVRSEDLVNLLNAKATFGSSADARVDEFSIKSAAAQKQKVLVGSTTTKSPLLAAWQRLKHLDAWATQKASVAAATRATAAQAVRRVKKLRALRATTKAKASLPLGKPQLGPPLINFDDNEDVSSDLGKIFEPVPLPNVADLVAKMAAPVDRPDLLAPDVQDIAKKVDTLPPPVLSNDARGTPVSHPKLKLRKPLEVPKASLGSSLGEVVSDSADNTILKLDLPAAPSPAAVAAAADAKKLFTEDLDSLGDLDSLNISSLMTSELEISTPQPHSGHAGSSSHANLHKAHLAAVSLGPPLGAGSSDYPSVSGVNPTAGRGSTGNFDPVENVDTVDSFLDEGVDDSLKPEPTQVARRSVNRAQADASALHALDSEVQRGAAASMAEINAAEAESEEGMSSITLPTVPLWGAPPSH